MFPGPGTVNPYFFIDEIYALSIFTHSGLNFRTLTITVQSLKFGRFTGSLLLVVVVVVHVRGAHEVDLSPFGVRPWICSRAVTT